MNYRQQKHRNKQMGSEGRHSERQKEEQNPKGKKEEEQEKRG